MKYGSTIVVRGTVGGYHLHRAVWSLPMWRPKKSTIAVRDLMHHHQGARASYLELIHRADGLGGGRLATGQAQSVGSFRLAPRPFVRRTTFGTEMTDE